MPDAYVIFRKRLPFSVRLNAENWEVSIQTGMKSGYLAVVAASRNGTGKFYILTAGKERDIERDMQHGIRVATGTPARGLVTAMRRAGVVIVLPSPFPHLDRSRG